MKKRHVAASALESLGEPLADTYLSLKVFPISLVQWTSGRLLPTWAMKSLAAGSSGAFDTRRRLRGSGGGSAKKHLLLSSLSLEKIKKRLGMDMD